jgi:hypothetical protein
MSGWTALDPFTYTGFVNVSHPTARAILGALAKPSSAAIVIHFTRLCIRPSDEKTV